MINKLTVIAVFLIMASAVNAEVLTASKAVETAQKNNPEIQAAKNLWKAAEAASAKTYSLPDPKLGVDFERVPAGSTDLKQAEMRFYNFSQTIPWPGMLLSEGSAAQARADMLKAAYLIEEARIVKEVKSAYCNLSKTDQLIIIMEALVGLIKQTYKSVQSNYAAGKASQIELLKTQMELNRMENELLNMKDERKVKNLELNRLLNSVSLETYAVAPLAKPNFVKFDPTKVSDSPRLKIEESALKETQSMIGSAYSNYFPETMIKIRNQRAGPSVGASDYMLEFSLPLWLYFRQNQELAQAQSNLSAKEESYLAMKKMIESEVKEISTELSIYERGIKLYDSSLSQSSNAILKNSLAEYKAGRIDFVNLLDSYRTYLGVTREYFETLANYYIKLAELEEITGGALK